MAQRAALARTLLQRPTAILFDEPFASLDALRRMELQIWLVRMLKEEGTAALFVTHDLDEALIMGDRIAVMTPRPGRIHRIYDAPPERRALEQPETLASSQGVLGAEAVHLGGPAGDGRFGRGDGGCARGAVGSS